MNKKRATHLKNNNLVFEVGSLLHNMLSYPEMDLNWETGWFFVIEIILRSITIKLTVREVSFLLMIFVSKHLQVKYLEGSDISNIYLNKPSTTSIFSVQV